RIDGGEDGDGAVGSADAGSDADARVDGLGKSGAVGGSVDGRHEREVQLVAAVFGEGHADQTAAVLGHEVDDFGGDFLRGHGEVAFVLAVLVVNQHNHAADRKSTRLNSSHRTISYAVFCLKKKKTAS